MQNLYPVPDSTCKIYTLSRTKRTKLSDLYTLFLTKRHENRTLNITHTRLANIGEYEPRTMQTARRPAI